MKTIVTLILLTCGLSTAAFAQDKDLEKAAKPAKERWFTAVPGTLTVSPALRPADKAPTASPRELIFKDYRPLVFRPNHGNMTKPAAGAKLGSEAPATPVEVQRARVPQISQEPNQPAKP
ncbi:hypothetical protein ACWKWU_19035 [Chitinophaga lutea]